MRNSAAAWIDGSASRSDRASRDLRSCPGSDAIGLDAQPALGHNLGFRGHFLTKARRYSVTFAALRAVRANYRAQADPWLTEIAQAIATRSSSDGASAMPDQGSVR